MLNLKTNIMARNRVIAFSDKRSDANGETKYVIKARHEYEEGMEFWVLKDTPNIAEAELFSKKESRSVRKALSSEGYGGAVDILIHQESNIYSVKPRIITPSFITDDFGFSMNPKSNQITMGSKINYTDKDLLIELNVEFLNSSYNFRTKEDAINFCDNNRDRLFEYIKDKFKNL